MLVQVNYDFFFKVLLFFIYKYMFHVNSIQNVTTNA